jgi:hypothetical protein
MNTITRWNQARGLTSLPDQVNRLFEDNFTRTARDLPTCQTGRHS